MDARLFFSTFALVFLAELGDKTQLASMAASAGTKSPLSVFAGSASALVLSSLIAVVLGSTLQRFISPHVLKLGAAILFLAFGIVLLINALVTGPAQAEEAVLPQRPSFVSRLVFDVAAQFERASVEDYEVLAKNASAPELRKLWEHLAMEERNHLNHLHTLNSAHGEHDWEHGHEELPEVESVGAESDIPEAIRSAINHEQATAAFYRELSHTAPLPAVRAAFRKLADEETAHATYLQRFASTGISEA